MITRASLPLFLGMTALAFAVVGCGSEGATSRSSDDGTGVSERDAASDVDGGKDVSALCPDGRVEGDLEIGSPEDQLAYASCKEVSGRLTLGRTLMSLPQLERVSLPQLATVGSLRIYNTTLTHVSLPALARVQDTFFITDNYSLEQVLMPSLARVGALFIIDNDESTATLSLPALRTIDGEFYEANNYVFKEISLANLRRVGGDFTAFVGKLIVPNLRTVGGNLRLGCRRNPEEWQAILEGLIDFTGTTDMVCT